MSPEQAIQYGIPGILVLVLLGVGKGASKLLDSHLATLTKMVETLDRIEQRIANCPIRVERENKPAAE